MGSPLFAFPVGSLPLVISPRIVSLIATSRAVHGLTNFRVWENRVNLQRRKTGGWFGGARYRR